MIIFKWLLIMAVCIWWFIAGIAFQKRYFIEDLFEADRVGYKEGVAECKDLRELKLKILDGECTCNEKGVE